MKDFIIATEGLAGGNVQGLVRQVAMSALRMNIKATEAAAGGVRGGRSARFARSKVRSTHAKARGQLLRRK
jgi:hypothetical protein